MADRLYVILRSDLESLTPGKAAAQVAHAASQCARRFNVSPSPMGAARYEAWEMEPSFDRLSYDYEGFGTTLVLDGGSFFPDVPADLIGARDIALASGVVRDPTYPLRDGKVTHLIDIPTCVWFFDDPEKNSYFGLWIRKFKLYNSNHD